MSEFKIVDQRQPAIVQHIPRAVEEDSNDRMVEKFHVQEHSYDCEPSDNPGFRIADTSPSWGSGKRAVKVQ